VTHSTQQIVPGRAVTHPGPVAEDRVTAVRGRTRPHLVPDLLAASAREPGPILLTQAVVAAVEAAGADSGIVEFSTLRLPHISYCFPAAGDAVHPMLYSETHTSTGTVLEGTATVGWRRRPGETGGDSTGDLERWVHFHASWVDDAGALRGGHLWPQTQIDGPLERAIVWPLHGITLINDFDDETELPVFSPSPAHAATVAPSSAGDRDAVFARVRPNAEIHEVVHGLTNVHGLVGGAVRGGTGSFVGAVFDDGRIVDGPATEVISLAGHLDDTAVGPLTCTLITAHGTVESGRLAAAGTIVGATYDLLLTGPPTAPDAP
jgi:predicted DNA-binding protein with PD1-like motif